MSDDDDEWWWQMMMNDDERWMENQVFGHNGGQKIKFLDTTGPNEGPGVTWGIQRDPSRSAGVTQRPQLKTWNHPKIAIVARPIIMQTYERSSIDLICFGKQFAFRQAFEGELFVVVNFYHDKVNDFGQIVASK